MNPDYYLLNSYILLLLVFFELPNAKIVIMKLVTKSWETFHISEREDRLIIIKAMLRWGVL